MKSRLGSNCRRGSTVNRAPGLILVVGVGLLVASCSAPVKRSFYVEVINTFEEKVPALVSLADEPYLTDSSEPTFAPARVEIVFPPSEAELSGFAIRKLSVRPVVDDEEGNATPELEAEPPYRERNRAIFHNDAASLLFIVEQNPDFR